MPGTCGPPDLASKYQEDRHGPSHLFSKSSINALQMSWQYHFWVYTQKNVHYPLFAVLMLRHQLISLFGVFWTHAGTTMLTQKLSCIWFTFMCAQLNARPDITIGIFQQFYKYWRALGHPQKLASSRLAWANKNRIWVLKKKIFLSMTQFCHQWWPGHQNQLSSSTHILNYT